MDGIAGKRTVFLSSFFGSVPTSIPMFPSDRNSLPNMPRKRAIFATALVGFIFPAGCASTKTSNTARTATEQLLLSNAIDRSLSNVSFDQLQSRSVFIQDKYLDAVDKSYLLGTLRHKALASGARLARSVDEADVVIEVRSGGIGTDIEDAYLGIPGISVPGMAVGIPETKIVSRNSQTGTAKIGLIAYDPKTGAAVGLGGQSTALSKSDDLFVLGVGPFRRGEIRQERQAALGYQPPTHLFSALTNRASSVAQAKPIDLVDGQVTRVAERPTPLGQSGDGETR